MSNTAQQIIAALTRTTTKPVQLDEGLTVSVKSLSLGALEGLQEKVKLLSDEANPRAQFQPVLQAAVAGLEEVTLEEMSGFLLEDLKKIADVVMDVGK